MAQNVALFGTHVTVDVISWGHIRVRWSPNPIWLRSLWKGDMGHRHGHRENVMRTLKLCSHQPRNYQKLQQSLARAFPPASEGARPCWLLGFGLGLQNSEKIKFCCLKPPTSLLFGHSGPNNLYSIHQPIPLALYAYEITWQYFSSKHENYSQIYFLWGSFWRNTSSVSFTLTSIPIA